MNHEHRTRLESAALDARRAGAAAPGWLPRWALRGLLRRRLRWVDHRIDAVERALAGEFALAETAPLHAELARLRALREALSRRLAGRG